MLEIKAKPERIIDIVEIAHDHDFAPIVRMIIFFVVALKITGLTHESDGLLVVGFAVMALTVLVGFMTNKVLKTGNTIMRLRWDRTHYAFVFLTLFVLVPFNPAPSNVALGVVFSFFAGARVQACNNDLSMIDRRTRRLPTMRRRDAMSLSNVISQG